MQSNIVNVWCQWLRNVVSYSSVVGVLDRLIIVCKGSNFKSASTSCSSEMVWTVGTAMDGATGEITGELTVGTAKGTVGTTTAGTVGVTADPGPGTTGEASFGDSFEDAEAIGWTDAVVHPIHPIPAGKDLRKMDK
jgi:hypothetical protein